MASAATVGTHDVPRTSTTDKVNTILSKTLSHIKREEGREGRQRFKKGDSTQENCTQTLTDCHNVLKAYKLH